jgi:zinc protease
VVAPDTWARYERRLPPQEMLTEADLGYRVMADTFDRRVVPPAGPNPSPKMPAVWRGRLANGIEVLGAVNDEVPTTTVSLRLKTGQNDETLEQLGLAALTAAMLNEATEVSSKEDLSNRLQKLGASISVGSGDDYTVVSVRTLTEHLDETLAIAAEKLLRPKFDPADLERLKAQTIEGIRQAGKNAAVVADNARKRLLYGERNAFAHPDSGTVETVSRLGIEDVRSHYQRRYSPVIADIVVVSNLPRDRVEDKLAVFESWLPHAVAATPIQPFPPLAAGTLYLIDKPGGAQSEIRIAKRAMPYDATGEFYRANLAVFPLGGAFNSRINLNLREDKGYTYGARAGFGASEYAGSFTASAGVRADVTAAAIREFVEEIEAFAGTGMTETELAFTQAAIGQSHARTYETPGQKAGFLSQILTFDLDESFVDEQKSILGEFTVEDSQQLAAKHMGFDDMIVVVVGDKQAIQPELESLGLNIVELDEDGSPLTAD